MKKCLFNVGVILSVIWISGCATSPANQPVSHQDNSNVQTAPAKTTYHHIDYKGESLK